jgi:hypothetical protein
VLHVNVQKDVAFGQPVPNVHFVVKGEQADITQNVKVEKVLHADSQKDVVFGQAVLNVRFAVKGEHEDIN